MGTTIAPRTNPSVGNPVNSFIVADALIVEMVHAGGATISASGQVYRGDGIVVAIPEYGLTISPEDVLDNAVQRWIERVARQVTTVATPARYFGAWLDQGKLYLDVVEVYSSAEEDRAVAAGRARNQISIWHNGRGEAIPTGGTGVTLSATGKVGDST